MNLLIRGKKFDMRKRIVLFVLICLVCFLASCNLREEVLEAYSDRDTYYTINCKLSFRDFSDSVSGGNISPYSFIIDDITSYNSGKLPPYDRYCCVIPLKSENKLVENGFEFKADDKIYQVTFTSRMFSDGWPSYIVGISCDEDDIVYLEIEDGIENLLDIYRK